MHRPNLGYLERVDLATLWKDEPPGFAPWFADPDRLAMLGRAAEAGAPVAVWLAERFGPEHRAVLDSLNRRGRGTEGYFGVEMGLWRIDDSPVAPRFDVVAAPDGGRGPGPLTETGPRRYRHPCRILAGTPPRPLNDPGAWRSSRR